MRLVAGVIGDGAVTPYTGPVLMGPESNELYVVWPDNTVSANQKWSPRMHFVKPYNLGLTRDAPDAGGTQPSQAAARQAAEQAASGERAERERLERELATLKAQHAQAATRGSRPPGPVTPRWAVVIGIDEYQALGKLTVCRNDAKALAKVLIESGSYDESRVILMTDDAAESQNRPTLATMKRRIEQVANLAGKGDTVLVYFSGHGITKDEQGYLVPMDGDTDSAVPLASVKDALAKSKAASKVLILDACHAGSAAKGVGGIAPSLAADVPGLVMLLSSAADQVSYPDEEGRHSIFSKYLVEGLSGAADADKDRTITQAELFAHIRRQMTDWCLKTGRTQMPQSLPDIAGDAVLARVGEMEEWQQAEESQGAPLVYGPSRGIPAADELYAEGLHFRNYPAFPQSKRDYLEKALLKFQAIIEQYPQSDKIDDAAFRMGEIYGGWYFQDWARAVQCYERCWQWDPATEYPARFNAAKIYEERLKNSIKAVELYNAVLLKSKNPDEVNQARERIRAMKDQ